MGRIIDEFIPHVMEATYVSGYLIELIFNNGVRKIVDFEPYVRRGGVFAALRDMAYFKRFFIDLHTICWPNGADVAPERLYELGWPAVHGEREPSLSDPSHDCVP
jgi:hypothetical protein